MKKLLIFVTALAIMLAVPYSPKADDIAFVGVNYEGNYGVFFGVGHTFGKVGFYPYARYSIDSTVQNELRLTKSYGAELVFWVYEASKFKVGLLASPFNLDWIDNQEEFIGTYVSQSGGLGFNYQLSTQLALTGFVKGKAQLLSSDTIYPDDITAGLAISTKKFW